MIPRYGWPTIMTPERFQLPPTGGAPRSQTRCGAPPTAFTILWPPAPVASNASIKVLFGHDAGGGHEDWTTQSDHGAFHSAGIPFLYFGVEDHPDYHKPTDTADKINAGFFYESARTILDAVTAIDRSLPLTPTKPHN